MKQGLFAAVVGAPFKIAKFGAALVVALLAANGVAACSSSSTGGSTPVAGDDAGQDAGPQVSPNNCVKAGDKGNELGIGAYCLPGEGCGSTSKFCTADKGFDNDKWFCSAACGSDPDCGNNAYCAKLGCVPLSCAPPAADAGTVDSGDPGTPFDAGYNPDALPNPGN